jgi:hypothetical protein
LLTLSLTIQWLDVAPWRGFFEDLMKEAPSIFGTPNDAREVEDMISQAGAVFLIPCHDPEAY